jgi:hypothetical protein
MIAVRKLANELGSSPALEPKPEVAEELAHLAERMRATVTPVIGYMELISQDTGGAPPLPPKSHRDWIATIERRLDLMRETCDQIETVCDVLRQSIDDREASTPPAPEARGD